MAQMLDNKQPSERLVELIDSLKLDLEKFLKPKVDKIFEVGRQEGFTDMEIGNIVRERMKGTYSINRIRVMLPDSAKHIEYKPRYDDALNNRIIEMYENGDIVKDIASSLSVSRAMADRVIRQAVSDGRIIRRGKHNPSLHNKILDMYETGMQQKDIASELNLSRITIGKYVHQPRPSIPQLVPQQQIEQPKQQTIIQVEPKPEEEPEQPEIYQINPEDYIIDDLPKYPRDLLEKIIIHLDEENSYLQGRIKYWDDRFTTELTAATNKVEQLEAKLKKVGGGKK